MIFHEPDDTTDARPDLFFSLFLSLSCVERRRRRSTHPSIHSGEEGRMGVANFGKVTMELGVRSLVSFVIMVMVVEMEMD